MYPLSTKEEKTKSSFPYQHEHIIRSFLPSAPFRDELLVSGRRFIVWRRPNDGCIGILWATNARFLIGGCFSMGQFHQHTTSSFYAGRSRKRKKTVKLSSFFPLLGSAGVKAACRTLVKLIPACLSWCRPRWQCRPHSKERQTLSSRVPSKSIGVTKQRTLGPETFERLDLKIVTFHKPSMICTANVK